MSAGVERAWIGLGSNLGGPVEQVRSGLDALAGLPLTTLVRSSTLYSNPPMGPPDQPDYVNAVAELETHLTARELLRECHAVESRLGRQRNGQRWGARLLDLDVIVYGAHRIDEPDLKVPHPGLPERAFVLYPLAEIAPALEVPGLGSVESLASAVAGDDLQPVTEPR